MTPTRRASATATSAPSSKHTSSKVVVPNGIGLNYQQAQDLWRGSGLVVLPAIDATGANRLPVLDRNWVVLAQKPAPGSKVDVGAEITATVKKYTDN